MESTLQHSSRFGWAVVGVLFAASVLNYVDRSVLGVVMPQVRRDLSLTNTEYGLAINAFLTTYMVFYILGGRLADRVGYRRMFSINVVFWSVASMLHALARGLGSLALCRALLGVGEGGFYPTAIRGASEWFGPANRAKAVGLIICGISVGMLVTPPIVAWITLEYGWRAAFWVTGSLGFLLLPFWWVLHRGRPAARGGSNPAAAGGANEAVEESGAANLSWQEVLRRRKFWLILFSRALTDAAWYFYLFWLPGYFQDVRGYSLANVGSLLWIPYFFADVGALGGGWLSSALIARGLTVDRGRKIVLVVSAVLGALGGFTFFAPTSGLALAVISLALLGHMSWASNIHTVITETAPPRHVAMLYGITGAAGTLLGALTQPLVGAAVDRMGYAPAFVVGGLAYLGAIGLLLAAGNIERIR